MSCSNICKECGISPCHCIKNKEKAKETMAKIISISNTLYLSTKRLEKWLDKYIES